MSFNRAIAPKFSAKRLRRKGIRLPQELRAALVRFTNADEVRTYLVGGNPRDHFLSISRENPDFDVVTGATLEKVKAIFTDATLSVRDNIVSITFPNNFKFDVFLSSALANKQLTDDQALKADAQRRDFTINALYIDNDGRSYNPLGSAHCDLNKNYLITILPPMVSFQRDPIRIFRAIYLTALLGFTIDPTVLHAIHVNLANLKSFSVANPGKTNAWLSKLFIEGNTPIMFDLLMRTGVLTTLFPQLTAALGSNALLNAWFQDQLSRIPQYVNDRLSLNYIYGLFMTTIFEYYTGLQKMHAPITAKTALLQYIIDESPLFQKNFESWVRPDYYYLLANEEWKKFRVEALIQPLTSVGFFSRSLDVPHPLHHTNSMPKMRFS